MNNQPIPEHISTDEWISIQEASQLLGVATATLRRWGDAGKVPMKRTLGGHRRFARAAIMKLADSPVQPEALVPAQPPATVWSVDEQEMNRHEWHARLVRNPGADRMRGLGQRLLGLLIQYINRQQQDNRFLEEARTIGATYGREAHMAGVSIHDTVEAFLFFRHSFSQLAMPLPGIAQPTDLAAAAGLQARISHFMDAILLGTITGYEEYQP